MMIGTGAFPAGDTCGGDCSAALGRRVGEGGLVVYLPCSQGGSRGRVNG